MPDPDGFFYFCVGRFNEALEYFDRVLLADLENIEALLGKAGTLDRIGRYADALGSHREDSRS